MYRHTPQRRRIATECRPERRAKLSPTSETAKGGRRLVIVESPAKAKTIKGYLGPGYVVEASVGHIRDLPNGAAEVPDKYTGEVIGRADRASKAYFGKPAMYQGIGGSIPFMTMLGERFPTTQFLITGVMGPGSNGGSQMTSSSARMRPSARRTPSPPSITG